MLIQVAKGYKILGIFFDEAQNWRGRMVVAHHGTVYSYGPGESRYGVWMHAYACSCIVHGNNSMIHRCAHFVKSFEYIAISRTNCFHSFNCTLQINNFV